jgi:cytochrome P450
MSQIPYARLYLSGQGHNQMLALHDKYGTIVRVAPNVLCYSHPDAMRQIRGPRPRGRPENGKDPCRNIGNENNIIGANSVNHARYRRVLANGFSHQAMLDQQPTINRYINLLFDKLKVESQKGKVDVVRWFNYTTFDIIGDLCFGEPFGCLQDSAYHPWVALIFNSMKHLAFISMMRRFKAFFPLLALIFLPKGLAAKAADQRRLVEIKVRKRLAAETNRLDFMTAMTTAKTDVSDKSEATIYMAD